MAEMMEALTRRLEFAFLSQRFWIMGQIGALIVIIVTFRPMFWAYNLPAAGVLIATIVWDLWRNAPKSARYGLCLYILAVFLWLTVNNSMGIFAETWIATPPILHALEAAGAALAAGDLTALAVLLEGTPTLVVLLVGATLGSILMLVSGVMGLMACRRAE